MKTLLAEVSANHCAPHVFTNPWNETLLPYQCHPESALQRSAHSVAFIRRGGMENRLGAPDERRVNHPAVDREGSHAVDPGFCRGIDYAPRMSDLFFRGTENIVCQRNLAWMNAAFADIPKTPRAASFRYPSGLAIATKAPS